MDAPPPPPIIGAPFPQGNAGATFKPPGSPFGRIGLSIAVVWVMEENYSCPLSPVIMPPS